MAKTVIRKNPDFKSALAKLASDDTYRAAALKDPSKITIDFKLSARELYALRESAKLSGHDITKIDDIITNRVADVDVDVDHCCCCCCCCGETAVVTT